MNPILAAILAGTCSAAAPQICDLAAAIAATPCEWEDSADCFWNARATGNGAGMSFVDIGGAVHEIPQATADRLTAEAAPVFEYDATGRPILPEDLTDSVIAAFTWAVVDALDPSVFFALPLDQVAAELQIIEPVTPEAAEAWRHLDDAQRVLAIECIAADPFLSLNAAALGTC